MDFGVLRDFRADLHVHSCLSPCGSLEMTPRTVARRAKQMGLACVGITDHNSAENLPGMLEAGRREGLYFLPGMEVTTAEEVHVLGFFRSVEQAFSLQELVYRHLPAGENLEDLFGTQVVANAEDEVEGINRRLLMGATDLNLEQTVQAIHQRGGLAVAAHVDREGFGILGQLGFIPGDLAIDALEVSWRMPLEEAPQQLSLHGAWAWITGSDAHHLDELGRASVRLLVERLCWEEFWMAMKGERGRRVLPFHGPDSRRA